MVSESNLATHKIWKLFNNLLARYSMRPNVEMWKQCNIPHVLYMCTTCANVENMCNFRVFLGMNVVFYRMGIFLLSIAISYMTISWLSADCPADINFRALWRLELVSWSAIILSDLVILAGKEQKAGIPISILFSTVTMYHFYEYSEGVITFNNSPYSAPCCICSTTWYRYSNHSSLSYLYMIQKVVAYTVDLYEVTSVWHH